MKDLKTKKVLFIDVREPEEQQVSTLPNAISEKEFLKNPEQHKELTIVAYCTIGYRSGKFAEKFKQWKILNLEGGILAWSHFNGKVYKNGKETDKVHVYSDNWNFLNSKYKAVYK
ncbi:MAG: rhodanese-like domain-containing protein [Lentisphaeraceae bacterium]|nr:rhodanese-like domain-containing protein [Lentisphaeraceae bacterium]